MTTPTKEDFEAAMEWHLESIGDISQLGQREKEMALVTSFALRLCAKLCGEPTPNMLCAGWHVSERPHYCGKIYSAMLAQAIKEVGDENT